MLRFGFLRDLCDFFPRGADLVGVGDGHFGCLEGKRSKKRMTGGGMAGVEVRIKNI